MNDRPDAVAAVLRADPAALRYARSLGERCELLTFEWRNAAAEGWRVARLDALKLRLHQLAGASAGHGLDRLADAARALERGLGALDRIAETDDPAAALAPLFDRLCAEAIAVATAARPLVTSVEAEAPVDGLLLCSFDPELETALEVRLRPLPRARVRRCDPGALLDELLAWRPRLVVIDCNDLACDRALALADELKSAGDGLAAIALLAAGEPAPLRHAAAAADIDWLLRRSAQPAATADALAALLRAIVTPPHVWIVADEPSVARFYELTLRQCGITTTPLPPRPPPPDQGAPPDAILVAVTATTAQPLTALRAIRLAPSLARVAIIAIGQPECSAGGLDLLEAGADTVLTAPVAPSRLVALLRERVRRVAAVQASELAERSSSSRSRR